MQLTENKKSLIQVLFRLAILLEVLWGARAWITWEFSDTFTKYIVYSVCALVSFIYFRKYDLHTSNKYITVIVVCLFLATMPKYITPMAFVEYVLRFFPVYVLACDRSNASSNLSFIATSLAIILIPGLILHVVMLYTGIFPGFPIQYPDMTVYLFFNYFVMLKGASFYEEDGLRFQSIFLEPGYLGTLMAFMLYAVKYDLKKKVNIVLLLGLVASFSLAGYLVAALGYILNISARGRKPIKYILVIALVYGLYLFGITYNGGDNYINHKIIERLQPDNEKVIAGNNRVSLAADDYYESHKGTVELFFGIGDEGVNRYNGTTDVESDYRYSIAGAGYKIYFIKYGIFSAIMIFLVYFLFIKGYYIKKHKKYPMFFLIIIIVTFVQASYPATYSWLIPFILGILDNLQNHVHQIQSEN